jgi:hypothetical protein
MSLVFNTEAEAQDHYFGNLAKNNEDFVGFENWLETGINSGDIKITEMEEELRMQKLVAEADDRDSYDPFESDEE